MVAPHSKSWVWVGSRLVPRLPLATQKKHPCEVNLELFIANWCVVSTNGCLSPHGCDVLATWQAATLQSQIRDSPADACQPKLRKKKLVLKMDERFVLSVWTADLWTAGFSLFCFISVGTYWFYDPINRNNGDTTITLWVEIRIKRLVEKQKSSCGSICSGEPCAYNKDSAQGVFCLVGPSTFSFSLMYLLKAELLHEGEKL